MNDFVVNPSSTAFLANRPAPSMTEGLLVLVQLVIAAMTTEPGDENDVTKITGIDRSKDDVIVFSTLLCFLVL